MSGSEEKSEQEHKQQFKAFLSTYDIFLSTYDISSIKRLFTRKFVKFHVLVVQQQRQSNIQKQRDARVRALDLLIFDKYTSTCSVVSYV